MKHNDSTTTPSKKRKANLEMKTIAKKEKRPKSTIKASKICRKKRMKDSAIIESATRDTIAETIAFVIQGQLTPIKPTPLPINRITKHNVVTREQSKRCCKVQNIKKDNTKPKVQTKTAIGKITKTNKKPTTNTVKKNCPKQAKHFKETNLPAPHKISSESKNTPKEKNKKVCIKKNRKNKNQSSNAPKSNHLIISDVSVGDKKIIARKKRKIGGKSDTDTKQPKTRVKTLRKRNKLTGRDTDTVSKKNESMSKDECNIDIKSEIENFSESIGIEIKQEKLDEYECPVTVKTELETIKEISPHNINSVAKSTHEISRESVEIQDKLKEPSEPKSNENINEKVSSKKQKSKKVMLMRKKALANKKAKKLFDEKRRAKLLQFWNMPKRHRVASLNAIAKVHCLYENESKAAFEKMAEHAVIKREPVFRGTDNDNEGQKDNTEKDDRKKCNVEVAVKHISSESDSDSDIPVTRTLRDVPGLRAIGKHWDMHDSISSDNEDIEVRRLPKKVKVKKESAPKKTEKIEKPKKPEKEKPKRQKKEKPDVFMDLKDMVVKKRMASLNATAMLAASYSSDKKTNRSSRSPDSSDYDSDSSAEAYFAAEEQIDLTGDVKEDITKEEDSNLIEVHTTPNKKVAVILNQDTDVTITGVYVNSTTRSTHHEGYCSIAGMQYRISATSHTQTAATAVATETLLQSSNSPDNANSDGQLSCSSKSYTPLDALSTMQPPPGPGIHSASSSHHGISCQPHQLSSPQHRQQKSSAFSPPHHGPPGYPPPSGQGYVPPPPRSSSSGESPAGFAHGYYQPAGPLISMTHAHGQPSMQQPSLPKSVPLSDSSPSSVTSPVHQPHPSAAPSSNNGDSSDNEVIITSVTAGTKEPPHPTTHQPTTTYRYSQYSQYPYSYAPQYHYPTPPPPTPPYPHHEMCYPVGSPTGYVRHAKYATPSATYHRYPYYPTHGSDIYPPSSVPPAQPSQHSQQVVSASPVSSSGSYPPAPTGPPPPPTIMETYPPPPAPPTLVDSYQPPPHYYPPTYGLPPTCYSHSPTRGISYINAAYQPCPCPLNTCPKNGHTGPLTGESKRSNISKDSMPLPPVALALPLEPASATGPPSPARGSAGMPSGGMPPPPSPAGASYQPVAPTPKQESRSPEATECKVEKRKARVGKAMVRSKMQNTMLLMCNPTQDFVKREIESPKDKEELHKKETDTHEKPMSEALKVTHNSEITCTVEHAEVDLKEVQKDTIIADESKTTPILSMENKGEVDEKNKDHDEDISSNRIPTPPAEQEPLPPCIATVAENVKVKNMKRKQSLTKEQVPDVIVPPPTKKKKVSSYKDFIRKHTSCFKINNGKRKLVSKSSSRSQLSKIKLKTSTKRRLNASKEQTNNRRIKIDKTPLTESNCPVHKSNSKKANNEAVTSKTETFIKKKSNAVIKTAAKLLDNLIAKNNVDKVIEEVISKSMRTSSETSTSKCKDKEAKKMSAKITKLVKSECKKVGAIRRKSSCKPKSESVDLVTKVPKKNPLPKWSNGWRWEGQPYEANVFINSDETTVVRRCYPGMRHQEGDIIRPGHCVLLKAGPRKNDLPYVAKIAALWENPDDAEMMMSLLWYYRPEHTEQGRLPIDQPDEVFASRHKDSNSVACIDDKCYVLTFNEYCRYKKNFKRIEEGLEEKPTCIPLPGTYPRMNKQPPTSNISPEMVFFCRKVYDFRQKRIIKNPA